MSYKVISSIGFISHIGDNLLIIDLTLLLSCKGFDNFGLLVGGSGIGFFNSSFVGIDELMGLIFSCSMNRKRGAGFHK